MRPGSSLGAEAPSSECEPTFPLNFSARSGSGFCLTLSLSSLVPQPCRFRRPSKESAVLLKMEERRSAASASRTSQRFTRCFSTPNRKCWMPSSPVRSAPLARSQQRQSSQNETETGRHRAESRLELLIVLKHIEALFGAAAFKALKGAQKKASGEGVFKKPVGSVAILATDQGSAPRMGTHASN